MPTVSPLTHSSPALALRQSPIPALRRLALQETEEAVVLVGNVASYYLKQMAQETVLPHVGGRSLVNRVSVIRPAFAANAH